MVDITLFELHLDDASFRSNAPFLSSGEEGASETMAEGESGSGAGKLLTALTALAVVGAIAWMLRNGKPEAIAGEDELVEVEQ